MKKIISSIILLVTALSIFSFVGADVMMPVGVPANSLGSQGMMHSNGSMGIYATGVLHAPLPGSLPTSQFSNGSINSSYGEFQGEIRPYLVPMMQGVLNREMEISQREMSLHARISEDFNQQASLNSRLMSFRQMGADSLNSTGREEYSQVVFDSMQAFFDQAYSTALSYSNSSDSVIAANATNLMQVIVAENSSITVNSTGQEKMDAFENVTVAVQQFKQNIRDYELQVRLGSALNDSYNQVINFQKALSALSQAGFNVTNAQVSANYLLADIQYAQNLSTSSNSSVRVSQGFLFAIKLGLDYEKQALVQAVSNSVVTPIPTFLTESPSTLESSFNVVGSCESAFSKDMSNIMTEQMNIEDSMMNSNVTEDNSSSALSDVSNSDNSTISDNGNSTDNMNSSASDNSSVDANLTSNDSVSSTDSNSSINVNISTLTNSSDN